MAVVGGGPAGLCAAEAAVLHGAKVTLFDAKPSVGRKFLVAGKGGMNMTHQEPFECFVGRYRSGGDTAHTASPQTRARWSSLLRGFSPEDLRNWARGLGVETFVASTGRVYPVEMKSAQLLRRWVARLRLAGVEFRMRHRLQSLRRTDGIELDFGVDGSLRQFHAEAVVLALGGGSWPQTGSVGDWVQALETCGIPVRPLEPSNCGWEVAWPKDLLEQVEGKPLKNVSGSAGGEAVRGELLVTRYGLEGGIVYALTGALREMQKPVLTLDFKPDSSEASLVARLGSARRHYLEEGGKRWRLGDSAVCLLKTMRGAEPFHSAAEAARFVKSCQLPLLGPRPLSEAISTAGGVDWSALDDNLMVGHLPGVFMAGEMLDWEAPTGGYLIQGCFSTGTRAGAGAAKHLANLQK